jgi:hypothetical protein
MNKIYEICVQSIQNYCGYRSKSIFIVKDKSTLHYFHSRISLMIELICISIFKSTLDYDGKKYNLNTTLYILKSFSDI